MSWEVLLRPRAEADLESARDWYEARQVGLGQLFIDSVCRDSQAATGSGSACGILSGHWARLLARFAYKIYYLIEGSSVKCSAFFMLGGIMLAG
jgi:hypothetical protein